MAKLSWPGLERASAMSSLTLLAGTLGCVLLLLLLLLLLNHGVALGHAVLVGALTLLRLVDQTLQD